MTDKRYIAAAEETLLDSEDASYARSFAAVARALDRCEHSERVALLLSTCRNEYLTANAVFVDLRLCLGAGAVYGSMFDRAFDALLDPEARIPDQLLDRLRDTLSQVPIKFSVWADRESLYREFIEATESFSPADRRDARETLAPRAYPRSSSGDVRDGKYLNVSLEEGNCTAQLEILRNAGDYCWAAARLLAAVAKARLAARSPGIRQGNLFEDNPSADQDFPWSDIWRIATERSEIWATSRNRGELSIQPIDAGQGAMVEIPESTMLADREEMDEVIRDVIGLAQGAVHTAQELLRKNLRPNVPSKPMPDPFVIDLNPVHAVDGEAEHRFKLLSPQLGLQTPVRDAIRVAVLECSIPEEWHNHTEHYVYDVVTADVEGLGTIVRDAIEAAADWGATALILPEYFIPRAHLREVLDYANNSSVGIIGGIEAMPDSDGCTVDEVVVFFPHSVEMYQGKQRPSVYEPAQGRFASDNQLHLFRDTPLGNLAVVVCSDYLEADLVGALTVNAKGRTHTMVVCSRNPRPEVFARLAQADAVRLYANVIVVNSWFGQGLEQSFPRGGCLVADPSPDGLAEPVESFGLDSPVARTLGAVVHIWELDMEGISSRSRRRPKRKWLPPSKFARGG